MIDISLGWWCVEYMQLHSTQSYIPLAIQTGQGSKFFYKYMGPRAFELCLYIERVQNTPSFRVCDSQINSETYVVTSEKLVDQRRMKNLCWQNPKKRLRGQVS
jgi:hypothetical protein